MVYIGGNNVGLPRHAINEVYGPLIGYECKNNWSESKRLYEVAVISLRGDPYQLPVEDSTTTEALHWHTRQTSNIYITNCIRNIFTRYLVFQAMQSRSRTLHSRVTLLSCKLKYLMPMRT